MGTLIEILLVGVIILLFIVAFVRLVQVDQRLTSCARKLHKKTKIPRNP